MNAKERDRRRFLKGGSAALAGLAVGAVQPLSGQTPGSDGPEASPRDLVAYGGRSRFVETARQLLGGNEVIGPFGRVRPLLAPLQDSAGMITPASLHFVISHGYEPPDLDPREHRFLIHGLVDRPLIFTLAELKRLPSVSRIHFLECAGNTSPSTRQKPDANAQLTHGWTGCSEWTGVELSLLLKEAGVKSAASWILAEGAERGKHTKSIPLEKAMDDCLVVYMQNGEPVRPEQGYPLRLLVPGWEGINNVKWLRRIKVVDEAYMAKSESTGYPSLRLDGKGRWFQFEMGPKSVITFPSGEQRLPNRGFYEITGLAWSGLGAVRRVEVSTDGGRTWKQAQLQQPVLAKAHTRFRLAWNWNGEEAVLQSRCTDDQGTVQPSLVEFARIWNVPVDYYQTTNTTVNHFNAIQPWRVARDGSVHNAMFS